MSGNRDIKADNGSFRLSAGRTTLIKRAIKSAVKKNWLFVTLYALVTIAGIIASYFVNGWISVAVSLFVAILSFIIGLRMLAEVITITEETR